MERVCFSFFKCKDNCSSVNKTSQAHLVIGGSFLECWYFNLGKSVPFEDTCQLPCLCVFGLGIEMRYFIEEMPSIYGNTAIVLCTRRLVCSDNSLIKNTRYFNKLLSK